MGVDSAPGPLATGQQGNRAKAHLPRRDSAKKPGLDARSWRRIFVRPTALGSESSGIVTASPGNHWRRPLDIRPASSRLRRCRSERTGLGREPCSDSFPGKALWSSASSPRSAHWPLAAQGFFASQGFFAAQGLLAAQGFAAQGFFAAHGFFAAQGFAAQGFMAAGAHLAAQGEQGLAASAGPDRARLKALAHSIAASGRRAAAFGLLFSSYDISLPRIFHRVCHVIWAGHFATVPPKQRRR